MVYVFEAPGNVRVTKSYHIPNNSSTIELQLKIENISTEKKGLSYDIVAGSNIEAETQEDARYLEAVYFINDKPAHINVGKLKKAVETMSF